MTKLKSTEDHLWLKEVDSIALQQSLRDLDAAYQNFFKQGATRNSNQDEILGKHTEQNNSHRR